MNTPHSQKQIYQLHKQTLCWLFAILLLLPFTPVRAEDTSVPAFSTSFDTTRIDKNGNVYCECTPADFEVAGFEIGDVVTVSFLDQTLDLPYCTNYSDVAAYETGLFNRKGYLILATNMKNFAVNSGIVSSQQNEDGTWNYAEGVTGPVEVSFQLKEKAGYPYAIINALRYSDIRDDYEDLSDEEFANFRVVETSGMGKNRLYRTASPVDPKHNRNTYADAALRKAGVTVALNLADTESTVSQFEGYTTSYYSTIKHKELGMNVDVTEESNKRKLTEGFRFMAENPGVYAINCVEGKDRTGFALAVLECLMGADYQEVISDYMVTYYNYYQITKDEANYNLIAENNIESTLERAFNVTELKTADLADEAEEYLIEGDLNKTEIAALKKNLAGPKSIAGAKVSLSQQSFVYNGKVQRPSIKTVGGLALTAGKDYSITWSNSSSKNTGTYTVTLTGTGDYTGQAKASYKILKAANPMKVRMKPVKVRYSKLKRNNLVIKRTKAFIVKKAKGKVSFRKKSGSKNIRIDRKTGKITIRKKTPKKLYRIKVKVTAAGTKNYRQSSKTVLLKVRVK